MKFVIAIALVLVWLFFPATQTLRWWRRWRARREAANYSRTLLRWTWSKLARRSDDAGV